MINAAKHPLLIFQDKLIIKVAMTINCTNLRSNFFNFLSLINCTKHFKKHSSSLVSFSQLGSVKNFEMQIITDI